jgi:hypothetical protein
MNIILNFFGIITMRDHITNGLRKTAQYHLRFCQVGIDLSFYKIKYVFRIPYQIVPRDSVHKGIA